LERARRRAVATDHHLHIRNEMAKRVGVSRTALQSQVRLSYVKVAEFQARG
jgi:predicted DNA-binding protein (UPF0251 family)